MELSKAYLKAMEIGYLFHQKYRNSKEAEDWYSSEECSELTEKVINLCEGFGFKTERALEIAMVNVLKNGFKKTKDYWGSEIHRGFIAGEIIGEPSEENLVLATKAEEKWSTVDANYGYYQEICEDVVREVM